jgi:hypothetical protein
MDIAGYITRSNMPAGINPRTGVLYPTANLDIFTGEAVLDSNAVDYDSIPSFPLMGDTADQAETSTQNGIVPGLSVHKRIWANSPFVSGQQQVLATPDNSTLVLRLVIPGENVTLGQEYLSQLIQSITLQPVFQIVTNLSDGSGTVQYGWNCYTADYQVAFNQLFWFGPLPPVYIMATRDPIPAFGPV